MENLLFIVAILMSVPLVMCLLVIRNKPKHSPNVASVKRKYFFILKLILN